MIMLDQLKIILKTISDQFRIKTLELSTKGKIISHHISKEPHLIENCFRTKPFTIDENKALILGASIAGIGGFAAFQELLKQEGLVRSLQENPLTDLFEQFTQASGEQRSSEVEPNYAQYQQPVYQPQQYQQYVQQPQAVAPVQ